MKNTLEFYTQDASAFTEDPRYAALLVSRWAWAGLGRFFRLKGVLAMAEGCRIDLRGRLAHSQLALKLGFQSVEELEEYLKFLASEDCGLVVYESGQLWEEAVLGDFGRVQDGRKRRREERERALAAKGKGPKKPPENGAERAPEGDPEPPDGPGGVVDKLSETGEWDEEGSDDLIPYANPLSQQKGQNGRDNHEMSRPFDNRGEESNTALQAVLLSPTQENSGGKPRSVDNSPHGRGPPPEVERLVLGLFGAAGVAVPREYEEGGEVRGRA